ncbi:hypothetical protein NQZ68_036292 [Dissostichus eleginoides]|nr:hypothetical protein NQZ68_036292 [Dissostichus eleginoides]
MHARLSMEMNGHIRRIPTLPSGWTLILRVEQQQPSLHRRKRPTVRGGDVRDSAALKAQIPGNMSADVAVSLLMLAGIVALGEASRRFLRRALADTGLSEYAVDEKYRVHAVAAVITTVVYAGGRMTGAVFNPALAFSTQFPCSGVLAEPPAGCDELRAAV